MPRPSGCSCGQRRRVAAVAAVWACTLLVLVSSLCLCFFVCVMLAAGWLHIAAFNLALKLTCLLVQASGSVAATDVAPLLLQMARPTQPLVPAVASGGSSRASSSSSSDAVKVGVELVGMPAQPVSARLSLLLPSVAANGSVDGWAPANASALWLEPATLSWLAEEQGDIKYVQLRWAAHGLAALQDALAALSGVGDSSNQTLLRVQLASASGAEIATARSSTALQLDASGAPLFAFLPNQAAYPPSADNSSSGVTGIPVRLLAGRVREPATLRYTLRLLTSQTAQSGQQQQQFLPRKAMSGFLRFEAQLSGDQAAEAGSKQQHQAAQEQLIQLPLAWDRIPQGAEYRMGG